jgi:hypothetical protein
MIPKAEVIMEITRETTWNIVLATAIMMFLSGFMLGTWLKTREIRCRALERTPFATLGEVITCQGGHRILLVDSEL